MGRYSALWPNQCMIGTGVANAATGVVGTVALYNNTQGAHYLIVRDYRISSQGTLAIAQSGYSQTRLTGTAGVVNAMLPTVAVGAGVIDVSTQATPLATANQHYVSQTQDAWYQHDFPAAVLPPGWSFVLQLQNSNITMSGNFIWEAVEAEQLRAWSEAFFEGA